MVLIPSPVVALCAGLAGLAWLLFAKSQTGRYHSKVLAWLSMPFFVLCIFYTWFAVSGVGIDIRAVYARFGIISIALQQTIILTILYFLHGGHKNGKQH